MRYKPKYAQGQILVVFKKSCSKGFIHDFGKILGYELADEDYDHGEAYIFKTKIGKEQEAKVRFETYPEFVEWVDLRDIKIEARWENLEKVIAEIQDLHDNVELPDNSYNTRLEEIRKLISKD